MKKKLLVERKVYLEKWLKENYPRRNLSMDKVIDLSLLNWSRYFKLDETKYLQVAYFLPLELVSQALTNEEEKEKLYTRGYSKEIVDARILEAKEMLEYIELVANTKFYNKLVRDNIPDIIKNNGENPVVKKLNDDDYIKALFNKDKEELEEVRKAKTKEEIKAELGDKFEVLRAMATYYGFTIEEIVDAANEKFQKNGGFMRRLYLEKVTPLKK